MTLPEPPEWEVTHTRLREAARKLLPYAESWKDTISWCEDGEDEIRAIEEFLDACREEL